MDTNSFLGLLLVIRFYLGLVFLIGSFRKIMDLENFVEGMISYQVLPPNISRHLGFVLPWVELIIGIALITGLSLPITGSIGFIFITIFIIAMEINIWRGRTINCNCYGIASTKFISQGSIFRNIILLFLLSLMIFLFYLLNSDNDGLYIWREDWTILASAQNIIFCFLLLMFFFLTVPLIEWTTDIFLRVSSLRK